MVELLAKIVVVAKIVSLRYLANSVLFLHC